MTEQTSEGPPNAGDRTDKAATPLEGMAAEIDALASGVTSTLLGHLAKLPEPGRLSRETSNHIAKRLPPKAAAQHANHVGAIRLLGIEAEDLGLRISRYRYIERYREYFSPPNAEVRAAFVNHIHVLRGSEIYVIMERCSDFLDFFYCLAVDLGLNPTRRSTALENAFKKSFERHLRERHRIVHAHERPSLTSRMIGLPIEQLKTPEGMKAYMGVVGGLLSMLPDESQKRMEGMSPAEVLQHLDGVRLKAVDDECLGMWSILTDNVSQLIDRSRLLA